MAGTRIFSDVAGRVCLLPFPVGSRVNEGDEIAIVEAMKMEIPLTAPVSGRIRDLLVVLDDVVSESQLIAIIDD